MNELFVKYHPFTTVQEVYVCDTDGHQLEKLSVPFDRVNDAVKGLVAQYNVKNIDLIGNRDYLSKFKSEMMNEFNNQVDINII